MREKTSKECPTGHQISGFAVSIIGIIVLIIGTVLLAFSVFQFNTFFVSVSVVVLTLGVIIFIVGYQASRCEKISQNIIGKLK